MNYALKYIMVRTPDGEELYAFCLPPLHHKELADGLAKQFPGSEPVSAGFVHFTTDGTAKTFGGSESLKLKTRPQDAGVLTVMARTTAKMNPSHDPLAA